MIAHAALRRWQLRWMASRCWAVAVRAVPVLLLAACATTKGPHPTLGATDGGAAASESAAGDGGHSLALEAGVEVSEPTFALSIGSVTSSCVSDGLAEGGAVAIVPEFFTAFRYLPPSSCESLDRRFLLFNTGDEPTEVLGLSLDHPGFLLSPEELPVVVQPGASFGVSVRYAGDDTLTLASARMTLLTTHGCSSFVVRGIAVGAEGRLVAYSPAAIDFGDVTIGTTSESQTITVLAQYSEGMPPNKFVDFAAGDPAFEIISAPSGKSEPASCEPLEVRVRFNAPTVPGRSESFVVWRVLTDAPTGSGEGTVILPLFAHAVAAGESTR
jgi:hypothetical protein